MMVAAGDDETQFWRQPNATVPGQFSRAVGVLSVVQTTSFVFYCVLLPVCAWGALERRRRSYGRNGNRMMARVSFWVFVHAVFCWLTQLSNTFLTRTTFASEAFVLQCHWHHKLAAGGYIAAMGAQYMVLLVRAELTLDDKSRWSRLLFKFTKLMTVAGMPAMVVLALITFKGTVFYAETCTQDLILWIVWLFMVSGSGLSACFLLMFVLPVFRHVRSTRNTGSVSTNAGTNASSNKSAATRRLLQTARHNLRLSMVQIISTLVTQLVGGVLQTVMRDDQGQPENSYLRIIIFAIYVCDGLINTVMLLFMSSAWQPGALQRLLRRRGRGGPAAQRREINGKATPNRVVAADAHSMSMQAASTMATQGGNSILSSAGPDSH